MKTKNIMIVGVGGQGVEQVGAAAAGNGEAFGGELDAAAEVGVWLEHGGRGRHDIPGHAGVGGLRFRPVVHDHRSHNKLSNIMTYCTCTTDTYNCHLLFK